MVTLRADENRYLVDAAPAEQAMLRRVPGGRWNNITRRWQFPRQRGVILALDIVFGVEGWEAEPLVETDIAVARRPFDAPQSPAVVKRDGNQLAVICEFPDRELVKAVPGYRWSATDRCWFLPAVPIALHLLEQSFGAHLEVPRDVRDYMDLRERDEVDAAERAARLAVATVPPLAPAATQPPLLDAVRDVAAALPDLTLPAPEQADTPPALDRSVLERLATAVDRLVVVIERLELRLGAVPVAVPAPAAPESAAPVAPPAAADPDWAELLRRSEEDAALASTAASRMLQAQGEGASRELRAVAAISAARAGHADRAFGQLSNALGPSAELQNPDLTRIARGEFVQMALEFLNGACRPTAPIADAPSLRAAILRELLNATGFDQAAISSSPAQGLLEQLMADLPLRAIDPLFSDLCRVLHLVSLARSNVPMLTGRVAVMLEDGSLRADAVGLGVILRTNMAMQADSVDEWEHSWPREERFDLDPAASLAARRALPFMDRELAPRAALATLAAISTLPADEVPVRERRELVNYINRADPMRRYAEFLAVFRIAAAGQRAPWDEFPGYVEIVAGKELATTANHIAEVYLADAGPGSAARLLADRAVLQCLAHPRGITDPQAHVLDLLPVLGDGSRPDNLLNELGRMVEDQEFEGAAMFTREQRVAVYRAALDASIKQGHDIDARHAFERLVRALQDDPDASRLRSLCGDQLAGMKVLRVPALALQAELLLEAGGDVNGVADGLWAAMHGREDDAADARNQLLGLQYVYPAFNTLMKERLADRNEDPGLEEPPMFPGKRVVIAGGREYMRNRGKVVLDSWGVESEWLDPEAAKQGTQSVALARGTADLIVVNTACIGHAASGRIITAARATGVEPLLQGSNGVGSMLLAIQKRLEEGVRGPVPVADAAREARAKARRRLVR